MIARGLARYAGPAVLALAGTFAWGQPVCYPGLNPLTSYPRFFPVERYHPSGEYWLWYCWDGTVWKGYTLVKPSALGPRFGTPEWEAAAGAFVDLLQTAESPKVFLDSTLASWADPTVNCADPASPYADLCSEAMGYMKSHFPPPRTPIVSPPGPSWTVKGNPDGPVYPYANGVRGTLSLKLERAKFGVPCDPSVAVSPSGTSTTQEYAAFFPNYDPTKVTLCVKK